MEDEAEQFDLPCPNLATEDTYGDGGEDDVRGQREDGVREVAASHKFSRSQFLLVQQAKTFEAFERVEAFQVKVYGFRGFCLMDQQELASGELM